MGIVLAFFIALGITGFSPPDLAPRPNIEYFNIVLIKQLEFRVDDCRTAFVGRVVVYRNPEDLNEYVRVYYRQVSIISECAQEQSSEEAGSLDGSSSNLNYHQKEEADTLDKVQKATDAFAYVQEWTVRDLRTGQDIRTKQRKIWLLDSSGVWTYFVQPVNEKSALNSSLFSEPSKVNSQKIIPVGIKFILGDKIHIVRIDQDDLIVEKKGTTDDKK